MSIEKDWAGIKFKIMRELGESIDIVFIRKRKGQPDHYYAQEHERSDGLGAFARLRNKLFGVDDRPLPSVDISTRPWRWLLPYYVVKHLWRQKKMIYRWKDHEQLVITASHGFAYMHFSKKATQELYQYCKEERININSLFLKHFDHFAAEYFLRPNHGKRVWMVPVNMRRQKQAQNFEGNHVTTLSVYVNNQDNPQSLYQQMRSMLKSKIIWGGEVVAQFPKYLGEDRLRALAQKGLSSPYFGLLTNLGKWSSGKDDDDSSWVLVAPASIYTPMACSLIEHEGELAVSCQLHGLLGDERDAKKICEHIVSELSGLNKGSIDIVEKKWSDVETIEHY